MPKARAEVLATAERWLHDVKSIWLLSGVLTAGAYLIFVPVGELLANESLSLLPGALILFAPYLALRAGSAHARSFVERRLVALVAEASRHHGASPVEVEPLIREELQTLLQNDNGPG